MFHSNLSLFCYVIKISKGLFLRSHKEIKSKKPIGKGCYVMARAFGATAQQETTMERVYREVFASESDYRKVTVKEPTSEPDCRTFRVEIRTPDGAIRYYGLKSSDKSIARKEALSVIQSLVSSFSDDRILWRMAGDRNWYLNGSTAPTNKKDSFFKRAMNYFFDLDDED